LRIFAAHQYVLRVALAKFRALLEHKAQSHAGAGLKPFWQGQFFEVESIVAHLDSFCSIQRRIIFVKPEKLFEELKAFAEQIGVEVIVEKGSFRGGHCTVYDDRKIVVNRFAPAEGRAAKLAEGLQNFPPEVLNTALRSLDNVYIKPALREYLSGYLDLEALHLPALSSNKAVARTKSTNLGASAEASNETSNEVSDEASDEASSKTSVETNAETSIDEASERDGEP
jgi:hypothetical protein